MDQYKVIAIFGDYQTDIPKIFRSIPENDKIHKIINIQSEEFYDDEIKDTDYKFISPYDFNFNLDADDYLSFIKDGVKYIGVPKKELEMGKINIVKANFNMLFSLLGSSEIFLKIIKIDYDKKERMLKAINKGIDIDTIIKTFYQELKSESDKSNVIIDRYLNAKHLDMTNKSIEDIVVQIQDAVDNWS